MARYFIDNRQFHAPWSPDLPDSFFTVEHWRKRLRELREEFRGDRSAMFFLFAETDRTRAVGRISFSSIVRGAAHFCYLGYDLDEGAVGNGYMTEGLQAAVEFMFRERNLHRIMANYMPRNARSAMVLNRLGFKTEGYASAYLRIAGRWEDHVLTALTNDAWKVPQPSSVTTNSTFNRSGSSKNKAV